MNDLSTARDPVEALAEEFLERKRRGEDPKLDEYVLQYPELASDIRDLFPALVAVENLKSGADSSDGDGRPSPAAGPQLTQLGDYRIIREVGRGGMGIVYEAEQVSLGRHVALKVLPRQLLQDAKVKQRFEREARAAARLHHTNIVPVYGVGEHEGTHYYAMQFIQGLGLDVVLAELRRIRTSSPDSVPSGEVRIVRTDVTAGDVARSLISGRFATDDEANPPASGLDATEAAVPSASASAQTRIGRGSETVRLSSASARLPVGSEASSRAKTRQPSYWHSVAQIGVQVASSLAYAHDQGVLHRDIKPSNLMLDLRGTVWITDFGLAKDDDARNLTEQGDILGTLRYMPPEAFDGRTDAKSDVYALGLTLYELLTFEPVFQETDRRKLIKLVTTSDPPAIVKLRRDVPRDLATIVHKAMSREPGDRYPTAQALAEDLLRFIDDVPILARRVSPLEQLWRWARHNRATAALIGAVAAVTLIGFVASTVLWRGAVRAQSLADRRAVSESVARQEADRQRGQANEARAAAEAERTRTRLALADMYTSFGLVAGDLNDYRQAVLWFANAAKLSEGDRERTDDNRIRAAAWSRQATLPAGAVAHPAEWIDNNLAFHAGGRFLLSHGLDTASQPLDCRLWDLERETELPFPGANGSVSTAAWDAAGERLAFGTPEGAVTVCRFPGGEPIAQLHLKGRVSVLAFSESGRLLAVAAGTQARVWDCDTAEFVTPELEHRAPLTRLALDARGEKLAIACQDHTCSVYAVPGEKIEPLFAPVRHYQIPFRPVGESPLPLLFVDGGRGLLTCSTGRGDMSWLDSRAGNPLQSFSLGTSTNRGILSLGVSPDGQFLAIGGYDAGRGAARIVELATGRPLSPVLDHQALQFVFSVAFSPDGKLLLTAGGDHAARLWSVPNGTPVGGPLLHPTSVTAVAFAPRGRYFATAQRGGLIRVWTLPEGNPNDYLAVAEANSFVRISPDGRWAVPSGRSQRSCRQSRTQVFEIASGQKVGKPLEAGGLILDAGFHRDGLQVALAVSLADNAERTARPGRQTGQVQIWDWNSGQQLHSALELATEPRSLEFSPDGTQLAALCAGGEVIVVNPTTGKVQQRWQAHPPHLANNHYTNNGLVRFTPDGRSLITYGTSTPGRVWDASTGQLRYELKHQAKCHGVQFSPDGKFVSTAAFDNQVCIWDLATGQLLQTLPHPDWTFTAPFSEDGSRLLTACRDGMARLWDWRSGKLVCTQFKHHHEVHSVAFLPGGRHVATASDDSVLRFWEWRTGKPVSPPLPTGGIVLNFVQGPEGRLVAGGFVAKLPGLDTRAWLKPASLSADDLSLWGEVVAGQSIEPGGGVLNLTADEWLSRWQDFRLRHPKVEL